MKPKQFEWKSFSIYQQVELTSPIKDSFCYPLPEMENDSSFHYDSSDLNIMLS